MPKPLTAGFIIFRNGLPVFDHVFPDVIQQMFCLHFQMQRQLCLRGFFLTLSAAAFSSYNTGFKGKVTIIVDIRQTQHKRVNIHCAKIRCQMIVHISHIILHMQTINMLIQDPQRFPLGGLLHISVARIPTGMEQRMVYIIYQFPLVLCDDHVTVRFRKKFLYLNKIEARMMDLML